MNDLVIFMYESGICLAALFLLYWLFLRKETYFKFNRFYLLGSIIVACLLPLGHFNLFGSGTSPISVIPRLAENIIIPEMTIAQNPSHLFNLFNNWRLLVIVIYLLGAALLIVRMILGIIRVAMIIRRGRRSSSNAYPIVYIQQELAPFSFFKTIVLNPALIESSDEGYIIKHEIIHIKQGHTFDNLLVEFFLSLFWFNPFMWLIRRALRNTHEYLADTGVVNETPSPAKYQSLLLKQINGLLPIVVTNSFNSTIKKRITMMCRNESSVLAKYKPLLLLPLMAILTLLFSCEENVTEKTEDISLEKSAQDTELPDKEIFYVVEEMPEFNGGDPSIEFPRYLSKNLRYPEIAKDNMVSGRVIVQFTVSKTGQVEDAVVVRKVNPALDKEAMRVILSSPKWTPGKQSGKEVNVLFTFPINFVMQ